MHVFDIVSLNVPLSIARITMKLNSQHVAYS